MMQSPAQRISRFIFHFSRAIGVLVAGANLRVVLLTFVSVITVEHAKATGFYGPQVYLDNGGENLLRSPEFFWDVEVKRLARSFQPTEKRIPIRNSDGQEVLPSEENTKESIDALGAEMTANADTQDFAAALKEGWIKPPDPAPASAQHEAARKFISDANDKTTDPLPEEFPSEFADYHKGAFAYKLGKWDEARSAWQALLNRPAEERHYRSVWAAFMLGKAALKAGDPQAVKWFETTRELAKTGLADPLGLAADSYGWEGRSEWKQNHAAKAAQLFLTQLALGDEGAVVSLKALIPDRVPVDGMVNYGSKSEEDSSQWSDERRKAEAEKTVMALKEAAKDPLLRQLVTAHILAAVDQSSDLQSDAQSEGKEGTPDRFTRWLSVIADEHIERVENADYLGWIAYGNGDYKAAGRWLKLADPNSPVTLWLGAKLLRRAGKLDEATKAMAQAQHSIVPITNYTGWTLRAEEDSGGGHWSFGESASGDLGAMQLEQAQFTPALESFLKGGGKDPSFGREYAYGGLWDDAAFVAERVLSADELKAFVDHQPVPHGTPTEGSNDFPIVRLRYLLGRRLVREDRYKEATQYLKPPYDKVLTEYVKALEAGANEKLPKRERARSWFKAAWLARYDGIEIMGTEGAPDGFSEGGDFEIPDLAKQQQTGFYAAEVDASDEKPPKHPIVLKPSKEELQRLSKTKITPDLRFHYRVIAGALAVRAADLLEDNSEELADVLNTAGGWVKDRDEKIGDRYFKILMARAPKTKIGRLAVAKHWFVNETGPWSEEQAAAEEKLQKDLGITKD
jgi:tetratricopeptide (TPR) repeat protein